MAKERTITMMTVPQYVGKYGGEGLQQHAVRKRIKAGNTIPGVVRVKKIADRYILKVDESQLQSRL